ncbi:MAG: tRNA uridine-5-carboxymethylaminomethyl(34) synthesis GTPase MnmE [Hyphomicrobiales bacterium]
MIKMRDDTIYALSSGLLPSGVAIIRISGPQCRFVIETICKSELEPRKARYISFCDPQDGSIMDDGLVLWFPGPSSFTGEDVLELHCHGGRAVVDTILRALSSLVGLRMAERGEFTRQAFQNNKMDFVGVEGLADLIAAETQMQRKLAQLQTRGDVSLIYDGWRSRLIRARALIEAELDFPDEEDVPGSVSDQVWLEVKGLIDEMKAALQHVEVAERIREGISVVLAGAPNAGKSSLLNALAGRDVAIVSSQAGTTRDVIEVHLDLKGVPVRLWDTAGLRDSHDEVESMGIKKATERIDEADIIFFLDDINETESSSLNNEKSHATIKLGTKSDLASDEELNSIRQRYDILISTKTGAGIDILIETLAGMAKELVCDVDSLIAIRSRHREAIVSALDYIEESLSDKKVLELRAEDLRLGADVLGRVTGRIDVEDMLDVVFREFCIGK